MELSEGSFEEWGKLKLFWSEFSCITVFTFVLFSCWRLALYNRVMNWEWQKEEGQRAGFWGGGVRGEGHKFRYYRTQSAHSALSALNVVIVSPIKRGGVFSPPTIHTLTRYTHSKIYLHIRTHVVSLKTHLVFGEIPLTTLLLILQCCQAWFHFDLWHYKRKPRHVPYICVLRSLVLWICLQKDCILWPVRGRSWKCFWWAGLFTASHLNLKEDCCTWLMLK